jgi:hypothetical protein
MPTFYSRYSWNDSMREATLDSYLGPHPASVQSDIFSARAICYVTRFTHEFRTSAIISLMRSTFGGVDAMAQGLNLYVLWSGLFTRRIRNRRRTSRERGGQFGHWGCGVAGRGRTVFLSRVSNGIRPGGFGQVARWPGAKLVACLIRRRLGPTLMSRYSQARVLEY